MVDRPLYDLIVGEKHAAFPAAAKGLSMVSKIIPKSLKGRVAAGISAATGVGSAASSKVRNLVSDYSPRTLNPYNWFSNDQQSYALDKKIDQLNQNRTDGGVNRGSTFVRNGQTMRVDVAPHQRTAVIDMLDAWHKDPELKGIAPPSVGTRSWLRSLIPGALGSSSISFPGIGPRGTGIRRAHISMNPSEWHDSSIVAHEFGHQRDYATRQGVSADLLPYVLQRPIATMRLESLAEDNAYRLNQFAHPETKREDDEFLADRDYTLHDYMMSHDPKRSYAAWLNWLGKTGLGDSDGGQKYLPPTKRGIPGQINFPSSPAWKSYYADPNSPMTPAGMLYNKLVDDSQK